MLFRVWRHQLVLWWAGILQLERELGSQSIKEPSNLLLTSPTNGDGEGVPINMKKKTFWGESPIQILITSRFRRKAAPRCIHTWQHIIWLAYTHMHFLHAHTYIEPHFEIQATQGQRTPVFYFQYPDQCLAHRSSPHNLWSWLSDHIKTQQNKTHLYKDPVRKASPPSTHSGRNWKVK